MCLTVSRWNCDALVTSDFPANTVIEGLECKGVLDCRVREPSSDRCRCIFESDLVFKVANMRSRFCDYMTEGTMAENAIHWASVAVDISVLTEAVLWDVILSDGQGVVVEPNFRYCRNVSRGFMGWGGHY